jgi:hypothetical protein
MPDLTYRITAQNMIRGELAGVKRELEQAGVGAQTMHGQTRGLASGMMDARDGANALASAMRGDIGGALQSLSGMTNSQIGAFAKLGAAGGAAFAGWQAGTALREVFGIGDAMDALARKFYDVELSSRRTREELNGIAKAAADAAKADLGNITGGAGSGRQRESTIGGLRLALMREEGATPEAIALEERRQAEDELKAYEREQAALADRKAAFGKTLADKERELAPLQERARAKNATTDELDRVYELRREINAMKEQRPAVDAQFATDMSAAQLGQDAATMQLDIAKAKQVNVALSDAFGGDAKDQPLQSGLEAFFDDLYKQAGPERTVTAGDELIAAKLDELIEKTKPGMRK